MHEAIRKALEEAIAQKGVTSSLVEPSEGFGDRVVAWFDALEKNQTSMDKEDVGRWLEMVYLELPMINPDD